MTVTKDLLAVALSSLRSNGAFERGIFIFHVSDLPAGKFPPELFTQACKDGRLVVRAKPQQSGAQQGAEE